MLQHAYNKIGRHLDLIKANKTSSDELRPIFLKRRTTMMMMMMMMMMD